ncbi:beta-ketoacyl-[acyl-carrier-protein] synthase family protein [Pseudoalteromonas sp. MMG005]|uniref:beta-ketoacyl-[acyl-carrier-protein] synthase family protein n=1 Tax=Pseudoalteromonas sp. MMG005 TaxID=2822682 RepID=UPI001B3A0A76|nr:beta-ketoacyl-[acyl-carrier-protein] synthase family protein [Pseudoalteromonas sp. MMG005]MBQ4845089.1 beta-ketoacyl-[acyl-carrier-protein] synthase family protein [Pseudoalteromonas sp. MMG005]
MIEQDKSAVVTGYGVLCSIGESTSSLHQAMVAGLSGVGDIERFSTDGLVNRKGALVKQVENISGNHFEHQDLATHFAIQAIEEALEQAHLTCEQLMNVRVALCLGNANCGQYSFLNGIRNHQPERCQFFPPHHITESVRSHFNILGPTITFTSACTASSSAIAHGKRLIESDEVDIVIAGGTDALAELVYGGFHSVQSLSNDVCSPYDDKTGLSLGEGAGFIVLESATHAHNRHVDIKYRILATGSSLDGFHATAPNPEGAGVTRSFKQALKYSAITAEQLEYINSHGTGTPANDGSELNGITNAIGQELAQRVPISSSKSYFGHTLGAAGAIEFISSAVAIDNGFLPATLNGENIRPDCQGYNLIINDVKQQNTAHFAVTNSAFGGHNTTLIVSKNNVQSLPVPTHRVFILGSAYLSDTTVLQSQSSEITLPNPFVLKDHFPKLFQRRMTTVSQFALGATAYALQDCNRTFTESEFDSFGAYFACSLGSADVLDKNINTLFTQGISELKSTVFPNTVVNATLGQLAITFGFKGSATCISDLGNDHLQALNLAYAHLREGRQAYGVVCSAEDINTISKTAFETAPIEPLNQGAYSCSLVLANETQLTPNDNPIAEVIKCLNITDSQNDAHCLTQLNTLQTQGVTIEDIYLTVLDDSHIPPLLTYLDKAFPQARITQNKPASVTCAIGPSIHQALQMNKSQYALVVSVNLTGALSACILKSLKNKEIT